MPPCSALSVSGGSPPTIKKRWKGKVVEGRMRSSSLRLRCPGLLSRHALCSSFLSLFFLALFFFGVPPLLAGQNCAVKMSYASEKPKNVLIYTA